MRGQPSTTVVQQGDPSLAAMNNYVTEQLQNTLPSYGGLAGLTSPRSFNMMDNGQASGPEHQSLANLSQFYSGQLSNPYELQGLGVIQNAANPTNQLNAANDYMNRIVSPSLINYATASGQGRSGAVNEALANAGAQMALPIQQNAAQMMTNFGGTLANY